MKHLVIQYVHVCIYIYVYIQNTHTHIYIYSLLSYGALGLSGKLLLSEALSRIESEDLEPWEVLLPAEAS